MTCFNRFLVFAWLALAPGLSPGLARGQAPPDFVKDVEPILKSRCQRCHGPKKAEGGLRLDQKTRALAGGDRGPAIVPGKSGQSRLIQFTSGLDPNNVMPPSGPRLTPREVAVLRAWIDAGAAWPDRPAPLSEHWAFRPVTRPPIPALKNPTPARNAIDHFILARLEQETLSPSSQADRATLLRRLSLDLTGMPPTPAQVDAFLADHRADAYEREVERLLAAPQYGERWARHWLDVARYADSDGYNADAARPIWKYRDWVIDAFNCDMPFDQFVIEQMAGDLLPNATAGQKTATGFHRNTLFNAEGGNDPEEFRVERVVDRVHTTATVFLGLTLSCAECHAHKYDPFSQRDFYQIYAFFNGADEATLETPTPVEQAARARHLERVKALESQKAAKDAAVQKKIAAELATLKRNAPAVTATLVLAAAAKPRPTRIHVRGDFRRPGPAVRPGVPEVLPPLTAKGEPNRLDLARWLASPGNPLTARVTVNRVWQRYFGVGLVETENDFGKQGSPPSHPQLLDWLASEFMARGWSMKELHRLIVRSATYRQASHHRADLTARDPRNVLLAKQNRLRLDAEIVRDVTLAASGLLSARVGGPSVFPYQPAGVMALRRSPRPWVVSAGADRYRRGMYTHYWRTSPHPFMTTFDAPRSDAACTRRQRSNTPLQALVLLNDPEFVDNARALASRILESPATDDGKRLQHAYLLCLGRRPTLAEQRLLQTLLEEQVSEFSNDEPAARQLLGRDERDVARRAAWVAVARVLLNLDEFITRE
ncbi:MAG: DUF1553 domain-containing protein [Planctomycetes bacterium]|nr:DUF1553 domain-containing protein [Planctomycetota bacterium]